MSATQENVQSSGYSRLPSGTIGLLITLQGINCCCQSLSPGRTAAFDLQTCECADAADRSPILKSLLTLQDQDAL
jgi:hypothetical protein